ncbi:MAG TPA: MbnP family protein [Bacteroidia bacterium]|nr:MbnP family protein [Bacteroidia bacterium]
MRQPDPIIRPKTVILHANNKGRSAGVFRVLTFLIFFSSSCFGTTPVTVTFGLTTGSDLTGGTITHFRSRNSNEFSVETLKFYVSGVRLLNNGKLVYDEPDSYHLIDYSDHRSLSFTLVLPEDIPFTQIAFSIGIDSLTNSSGARGGDLDPTKGMYWTWQSGYINFKAEGSYTTDTTVSNPFQYHLGGYQSPFITLQHVSLQVKSKNNIYVQFDAGRFLEKAIESGQQKIMSPGEPAMLLSEQLPGCFKIKLP